MLVKPGSSESVYEAAWRDPRGMVKATRLESQSAAVKRGDPPATRSRRGRRHRWDLHAPIEPSGRRAVAKEVTQGDERDTCTTLGRPTEQELGIA